MGGVFGVVSNNDCVTDLFFGTDYHSHLGTKRGGMCVYGENGFNRAIHDIETAPFRTKFEKEVDQMTGTMGIGSISDGEPQPLTVFSRMGDFSIGTVGRINNKEQLVNELLQSGCNQFMSMSSGGINNTELVAALISTENDFIKGIRYAQEKIDGSITLLLMTREGVYAARDKYGRTPLIIGKKKGSYCAASESFAFINLGYKTARELGPSEIVFMTPSGFGTVSEPEEKMRICTFLWTYFGYPTSTYEGLNVEEARYRSGASIAEKDTDIKVDYVAGVPDSGTGHALGYANKSGIPFARPLIKYTPTWPRSFMPQNQKARELIARMKLIPVHDLIKGKKFVIIDDSIVRGTQLTGTVKYLYENGAKEIHVRSACPPIMFGCKYLNFSRSVNDMDLITRRTIDKLEGGKVTREVLDEYVDSKSERHANMVEDIRKQLNFKSLKYHELEDTLKSVSLERCKLCTYCWDGKE
ncbi:MAG: amidophosphoribosyltransferase [Eubacteriales bacterium]|nr:amidophosphoribosyltransferase [Eubacteriales bacterium]MDD3199367.1 amidophosphoribosyltransferase [Eubacteriales bacterium]MDD4629215.1 amidophosphoribosyltransferase [Eubacteriales bacterium]